MHEHIVLIAAVEAEEAARKLDVPSDEKRRNKYGNYGGQHVGDTTLNDVVRASSLA